MALINAATPIAHGIRPQGQAVEEERDRRACRKPGERASVGRAKKVYPLALFRQLANVGGDQSHMQSRDVVTRERESGAR